MKYRKLGKTGFNVSEVSLGTWQLGGGWGVAFSDEIAREILETAISKGINFFDTADVYSDGNSERMSSKIAHEQLNKIFVATKNGRRLNPHTAKGYTEKNLRMFLEDSLTNMNSKSIDLLQLHCPPTEVYRTKKVFDILDKFVDENLIKYFGVSVEKEEEALLAMDHPNVSSVQIIFNMFRLKPAEKVFIKAKEKDVGIIVRVPLASGLLTGKIGFDTTFPSGDHRTFNKNGEAFDRGETFSGIDLNVGIPVARELQDYFQQPLSQIAIKWILMFEAVSTVIPGASKVNHVSANASVSEMSDLSTEDMNFIENLYNEKIKTHVHHLW